MRHILLVMAAFIGGGIVAGVAPPSVMAAPPQLAVGGAAPVVETIGYRRRYCKYNDCTGDTNVDVDVTAPADVTLNPPVVAIVPVRPVSCGEYHYWDGERCVDARYNNPYLGPR